MEVFCRGLFQYNVARPRQDYEEKFENVVFSIRPTDHTNPSRERNLKTPAFLFLVDGKHFALKTEFLTTM